MATILLAEDNEAVRLLTQAKLRHQFTVVTAANGRETLDILNRAACGSDRGGCDDAGDGRLPAGADARAEGNEIPVLSSPLCNPWTASGRAFLPALTIISPSLWITRS